MSLTRNEWLEMWASVKLMESSMSDLMIRIYPHVGPFRRQLVSRIAKSNLRQLDKIKNQIQSVIGQME